MKTVRIFLLLGVIALAVGLFATPFGVTLSWKSVSEDAHAQEPATFSPVRAVANRDVYYPGTEDLTPNEMRVTACGTGMPNARPKQAAACWLVELGNGDKFLFDIGTGSAERISALKIPYNYLDKVFIGHLHSDHLGDLDALWVGGVVGNRVVPLRVWGPNSAQEKYGTSRTAATRFPTNGGWSTPEAWIFRSMKRSSRPRRW